MNEMRKLIDIVNENEIDPVKQKFLKNFYREKLEEILEIPGLSEMYNFSIGEASAYDPDEIYATSSSEEEAKKAFMDYTGMSIEDERAFESVYGRMLDDKNESAASNASDMAYEMSRDRD